MNKLKQKYYTYNLSEFLPIYQDGVLSNKREYHKYKMKCLALYLVRGFDNAFKKRSTPIGW